MIARPLTTAAAKTPRRRGGHQLIATPARTRRPDYLAWVHDVVSFRHQILPAVQGDAPEAHRGSCSRSSTGRSSGSNRILEAFRDAAGRRGRVRSGRCDRHSSPPRRADCSGDRVGRQGFYQLIGRASRFLNPGRGGPAAVEEHWVARRTRTSASASPRSACGLPGAGRDSSTTCRA